MVVQDLEMMSHGEVESPLQSNHQPPPRNNVQNALGRQSSIYALTLDEFQHTLCESRKNFGSMNMDEFLNSIWTAEENQAQGQATTSAAAAHNGSNIYDQFPIGINASSGEKNPLVNQLSLSRQGSLTLPGPLSHKTVDEVWSEIQNTRDDSARNVQNHDSTQRQPTYGEMTLEDFLVKAGVVREENNPIPLTTILPPPPPPFASTPGLTHMVRPVMGGGTTVAPPYQPLVSEQPNYRGMTKMGGTYQPPPSVCYGGGSAGGYGAGVAIGSPVSPVSPDGVTMSRLDSGNQYGTDAKGGRKRIIDGPVEKVVERRQRRMIKNRESAARSRARKQAYTVELEAELNMLKEENAHLRQVLAVEEEKCKQQFCDEMRMRAVAKSQKGKERPSVLRRSLSCPY